MRRALTAVVEPFGAVLALYVIVFLIAEALPDAAERRAAWLAAAPDFLDRFKAELGLDRSLGERFWRGAMRLLTLEWGASWDTGFDVRRRVVDDAAITLGRAAIVYASSLTIAVSLAHWVAPPDRASSSLFSGSLKVLSSVPPFVYWCGWLAFTTSFALVPLLRLGLEVAVLGAVVIPVSATLALGFQAERRRLLASTFADSLRAYGYSEGWLRLRLWRNTTSLWAPQAPLLAITILTGLLVPEALAHRGGIGESLVRALFSGDLPVLLGCVVVIAIFLSIARGMSEVASLLRVPHP